MRLILEWNPEEGDQVFLSFGEEGTITGERSYVARQAAWMIRDRILHPPPPDPDTAV